MSYTEDLIKDLATKTDSRSANAVFSTVAHGAIASSTEIVAPANDTKGIIITNATSGAIYLKLGGGTVSSTSYSIRLTSNSMWEAPYYYGGSVTCIIGGSATGSTFVTILK